MQVLLVSGFLGAGKTTTLMKILPELKSHLDKQDFDTKRAPTLCGAAAAGNTPEAFQPIVVIENEVGDVTIDSMVLQGSNLAVKNIVSGCVCCALVGELLPTLNEIEATYHPELVVIETTGVAAIGSILDQLKLWGHATYKALTLVDLSRWMRIRIPLARLLEGQISQADALLFTKGDLIEYDGRSQAIEEIVADAKSLNTDARYFVTEDESWIDELVNWALQ